MATITLTGRPCHRAEVAVDEDEGGPCTGLCICGGRWCDDSRSTSVTEWYWIHNAPQATS